MNIENMDISPELREKAKSCKTPEELLALAKSEGYKLSDAEMEAVAGGGTWNANSGCNSFRDGGFDMGDAMSLSGPLSSQGYVDALARAGVPDVLACLARLLAFKTLALVADLHPGNYGVIRNFETGACRAAPPFDYDRSFGFLSEGYPLEVMCENPGLASLLCAKDFSGLDSSWDWSWYDPERLSGFEDRIEETYAPFSDLPSGFGELVARLFAAQRDYVNEVASCSRAAKTS